jgi:hypothetical protein
MKDILKTTKGTWREIENAADAHACAAMTETAVGLYFKDEMRRRAAGHEPNRYFVLVGDDGRGRACLSSGVPQTKVANDGFLDVHRKSIVTGYANGNPYPNYGDAIDALGAVIGRDLRNRYPYQEVLGVVPPVNDLEEDSMPMPQFA